MKKFHLTLFIAVFLFSCKTPELITFPGGLLSSDEYRAYLGTYIIKNTNSDGKINNSELQVYGNNLNYYFIQKFLNNKLEKATKSNFLLFKIPNQQAVVVSIPEIQLEINSKPETITNAFALLRKVDDFLYVWVLMPEQPILKGNLNQESGALNGMKQFLIMYADAYTQANQPTLTFIKKN